MKNLILSVVFLAALSSCKKETSINETAENMTEDSLTANQTVDSAATVSTFKHVEVTPSEMTTLLGKKNNDTLYVTNFFATWCGPCMREIPHFKEKMAELKSQPVKFTFISLDEKSDWSTKVKKFSEEQGLSQNVVLLDGSLLTPEFFPANFKQWDGGSIPFTFMRKGDKTDETVGMMSAEMLAEKINSFK